MPVTVAIVGRPNVGKSTLFNRLAGKRLAIVDDTPGVTRDRALAPSNLGGLDLMLIDTAGFDKGPAGSLTARMAEQTKTAIKDADVVPLRDRRARRADARAMKSSADALRRSGKPVILAANKSEGKSHRTFEADSLSLGFGEPVALSAEHGIGLGRAGARRSRRLPMTIRIRINRNGGGSSAEPESGRCGLPSSGVRMSANRAC